MIRFVENYKIEENKLIVSGITLDGIRKGIADYFYDNSIEDITLKQTSDNTWDVYKTKSGKYLKDFKVTLKKGRYRFESI